MAMRLRVLKDGTRSDIRLCDNCNYSHIIKGPQQGQGKVYCSSGGAMEKLFLPFPVTECNEYSKKGEMSEYEAKEIGRVLEVKKGVTLGFKPPKKAYEGPD